MKTTRITVLSILLLLINGFCSVVQTDTASTISSVTTTNNSTPTVSSTSTSETTTSAETSTSETTTSAETSTSETTTSAETSTSETTTSAETTTSETTTSAETSTSETTSAETSTTTSETTTSAETSTSETTTSAETSTSTSETTTSAETSTSTSETTSAETSTTTSETSTTTSETTTSAETSTSASAETTTSSISETSSSQISSTVSPTGSSTTTTDKSSTDNNTETETTPDSIETTTTTSKTTTSTTTTARVTTISTPAPSTTPSPTYEVSLNNTEISLKFVLTFSDLEFNDTLTDKTSELYQTYKSNITKQLEATFADSPGFVSVLVTNIRKGSTVIDYSVIYAADSAKVTDIQTWMQDNVQNFTTVTLEDVELNITAFNNSISETFDSVLKNECEAYSDVNCPFGYNCRVNSTARVFICSRRCIDEKYDCGINGECYVDYLTENLMCRCTEDDKFVYTGTSCDTKAEKLKLDSTYIIIITAVGGGLLIFIIVILICVIVRKSRNNNGKLITDGEYTMDDLDLHKRNWHFNAHDNQGYSSGLGYQPESTGNQTEYRTVPGSRDKDGYYSIVDTDGVESTIYNPAAAKSGPSRNSQYDKTGDVGDFYRDMDTETTYSIQRPSIKRTQL